MYDDDTVRRRGCRVDSQKQTCIDVETAVKTSSRNLDWNIRKITTEGNKTTQFLKVKNWVSH